MPGAVVFVGKRHTVDMSDYTQWWKYVAGANWRHPEGPQSSIAGKNVIPVVQVSYEDAVAYAHWVGMRLQTEAESEFAARGGLEQATFAWAQYGEYLGSCFDVTVSTYRPRYSPPNVSCLYLPCERMQALRYVWERLAVGCRLVSCR